MLTSVTYLGIRFHTEINGRPSGLEHSPADGSGQSTTLVGLFLFTGELNVLCSMCPYPSSPKA